MKIENSFLMLIATVFTFMILILMIFKQVPTGNKEIVLAFGSFVMGFFFGSSATKQRKELPNDEAVPPPPTPPTPPTPPGA